MLQSRILEFVRSRAFRKAGILAVLGGLAACSTATPPVDQHVEATQYKQHARGTYAPPGPPDDPWGPYIEESSAKFDVPERWVREVMRVESGGREYLNGDLITSPVGAMGLMQVMPSTFDEVRARHDGIGDDPFDPHNNILAGSAYIREMYDVYGSPGFLAAYNAGPRRLDDYLAGSRPLPDETRHYVAMIGPYIADSYPQHRSEADLMALNTIPIDIPPGTRYGQDSWTRYTQAAPARRVAKPAPHIQFARNERGHEHQREHGRAAVQLARAEIRPAGPVRASAEALPTPPVEVAEYAPPHAHGPGFHILPSAMAAEPARRGVTPVPMLVSARGFAAESRGQHGAAHEAAAHGASGHESSGRESSGRESSGREARTGAGHARVEKVSATGCRKPAHHGAC